MKKRTQLCWIVLTCLSMVAEAESIPHQPTLVSSENQSRSADLKATANPQQVDTGHEAVASLNSLSPAEALNEWVKIKGAFQRKASSYAWLASVGEQDLLEVLRLSSSLERRSFRADIQAAAIRRIASIDPKQAMRWVTATPRVLRRPLLSVVFQEWSLKNLGEAIDGAKSLDGTDRRSALKEILSTRDDLSAPTVFKIAQELGLEEMALQSISKAQTLDRIENPSSAWDALVEDGLDDATQVDLLKLVVAEWREKDGLEVLLQVARRFTNEEERMVFSSVIEAAVESEIGPAFDYVRQLPHKERGELPFALAMVAVRIDPEIAIKELDAWKDDPIHVQLQRTVCDAWAQSDPRAMLDALDALPQVAREPSTMELAFTRLTFESPAEALQYFEATKEFLREDTSVPRIIAKQWSHTDPRAALEWGLSYSENDNDLRDSLITTVLGNFVHADLSRATELSRDVHSSHLTVSRAEYDVIWELARRGQLDDAISHLPQLEDSSARYFATEHLGRALVRAGRPIEAVVLGMEVEAAHNVFPTGPATYLDKIFDLWATRDPQKLFHSLQSLSSPLIRSIAAHKLIELQESTPALTADQIESANVLLKERPIRSSVMRLELELQAEKGLIDLDQVEIPEEWFD